MMDCLPLGRGMHRTGTLFVPLKCSQCWAFFLRRQIPTVGGDTHSALEQEAVSECSGNPGLHLLSPHSPGEAGYFQPTGEPRPLLSQLPGEPEQPFPRLFKGQGTFPSYV